MARILDCVAMKRGCPIDFFVISRAALAHRVHALGERALFVPELATGANRSCSDVTGIWSASG
jgi:hypothetical protein